MISCTEFIPFYSEFFKFLESKGGYDEVLKYWENISDTSLGDKTNPNSLISFCEKHGGFIGGIKYWEHTLTEEACDVQKIYDYDKEYYYMNMRACPSRGMLNKLEHIEPYHRYCDHCKVIYDRVLKKYGMTYEMDHSNINNAMCTSLLYRTGKKPTCDVSEILPHHTVIDMKADDNKYLHRDFHLSGDKIMSYCVERFGYDELIKFLKNYAKVYYAPVIEKAKEGGLEVFKNWLENTYEKEEASDLIRFELTENKLTVTVDKSPVVEFAKSLGQELSEYNKEQTLTLMKEIANLAGFDFEVDYYNEDGGTKYHFIKR